MSTTCYGIHWNTDLATAKTQFESWGFHGVADIDKLEVLNGNDARAKIRSEASLAGAKWFYLGETDLGTGDDSAIYRFEFDTYSGGLTRSGFYDHDFAGGWTEP